MTIPRIVGNCVDCGKELHLGYATDRQMQQYTPQNFRSFNDGKILRCLECCKAQGIKEPIKIKKY